MGRERTERAGLWKVDGAPPQKGHSQFEWMIAAQFWLPRQANTSFCRRSNHVAFRSRWLRPSPHKLAGAVHDKKVSPLNDPAAELAIEKKYDYVICGHIHQPQHREIQTKNGKVTYLNSGDWIENLTSLEYTNGEWKIYHYDEDISSSNDATIVTMQRKTPQPNVMTDEIAMFINSLQLSNI